MTPFSVKVRYHREKRGLSQQQLAERVSVASKLISAIETGRRRPPDGEALQRLYTALQLSDAERRELDEAASNSSYIIHVPREISPLGLELAHRFMRSLGHLQASQISAIEELLGGRGMP